MQWLVNTSLLKVICRGVWLCKLTYPVIYRLTMINSDLRKTSNMLSIIQKQLSSILAITTAIYEMTWSPSSVLILHRSVQLKLNSDVKLNYQVEPKTNKDKFEAKRHNMMPTMQQTRHDRQNRVCLAQRLWTYVKNTTSVSSCDLEQGTPSKYPKQRSV